MRRFATAPIRGGAVLILVAALIAVAAPRAGTAQDGDHDDIPSYRIDADGKTAAGWESCPLVAIDQRPIAGGCVVRARAPMRFRLLTPFGPVPFAKCDLRFDLHIGYEGTVALDGIEALGGNPCGDIRTCLLETDSHPRPWVGDIAPGGAPDRFRLRVDACLDTCAGWFEGPMGLRLRRTHDGWRVSAAQAEIGHTGLEIDGGESRLAGSGLRLRSIEP